MKRQLEKRNKYGDIAAQLCTFVVCPVMGMLDLDPGGWVLVHITSFQQITCSRSGLAKRDFRGNFFYLFHGYIHSHKL